MKYFSSSSEWNDEAGPVWGAGEEGKGHLEGY